MVLFLVFWTLPLKAQEVSLKGALLKFERDLKSGAPKEVLANDLKEIRSLKRVYPVYYLPELNYLTGKEIEKVPSSYITFLRKLYFFGASLENALKVVLLSLAFYLFLFYIQGIGLSLSLKRLFSFLLVVFLLLATVVNLSPLLFLLGGLAVSFSFSVGRRYLSFFLLGALLSLSFLISLKENLSSLLTSPSYLYSLKVERDGYCPEYLISEAVSSEIPKEIEFITNSFALGDFSSVKKLKSIKPKSPYLKAVVYNDLGYFYFYKGDFKKALNVFKEALNYYKSPVIQFNLYLTYSSLLKFNKANAIRRKLLKDNPNILKALPVPLLLHVKGKSFKLFLPYLSLFSLVCGIALGFFVSSKVTFALPLEESFLKFPGMLSFINQRYHPFLVLFFVSLLLNLLIGKLIWGT